MEEDQKKNVGRALTTDEIRLQASKWTLAGDVGLLAHLEQFSQNLLSKSQETQNNMNALYDAFEDASTTINNVTNQFLALQNSQFVENRVYDDESPNEEQKIDEKVSKEEQEKYLLAQYKKAVEIGVKVLDTHFEEVPLPPNSDSDDDEVAVENSGLIWKSKNPYAGKRFPLLIGSAEWWADDNVGLGEYEENINPETVSSASDSDLEAENTTDKRIRMSSSSSTESERILSKRSKNQVNSDYDDIFAPIGKDALNVKSDLFTKDSGKLIKTANTKEIEKNNLLDMPENDNEVGNSYLSKQNKNYVFDDDEEGNSEDECGTEHRVSITKPNKISNAFTKELASKLSSVAGKNLNESTSKNILGSKSENKEKSALFDDNDDNDDLFSAQNSASNALRKKKSIFADVDNDDQLFGNSDNLFSDSKKEPTPSVKINHTIEPNETVPKENNGSNMFDKPDRFLNDDLFGGNDDFLFSGKSGLGSSHNSGGPGTGWKNSREVKFSTPTEQRNDREMSNADIFGGVSEIRSNDSSNVESASALNNEIDNSFNFSRFSSADTSKDYGFVEPSELSNSKSGKVESPGLFDPLLTSTRQVASDTSDYKTHRSSNQILQTKSDSSMPQLQDDGSGKMGHSENTHFSRPQSDTSKNKSLFDEDEDDDLFQTNKISKPVKEYDYLFDGDAENDCLSDAVLPQAIKNRSILEKKEENSIVNHKPFLPPVEDNEEERFSLAGKLKQDSVSMSSSRSSLFDDANVSKTNLASVFDSDRSFKNTNDLFGKTDDDLFGEDNSKNFDGTDAEDLFGDNLVVQTKPKNNTSLFDDLEDADDLFGDDVSKKLFQSHDGNSDLFGKPEKREDDKNSSTEKLFNDNQKGEKVKIESTASLHNKTDPVITTKKSGDDVFDEADNAVRILKLNNSEESALPDKTKQKLSTVSSLFGELEDEDEDEDLFSNVRTKENENSSVKSEKIIEGSQGRNRNVNVSLLNDNSEESDDDAIFKAGNSKKKVSESVKVGAKPTVFEEPLNGGTLCDSGNKGKDLNSDVKFKGKLGISAITSNINNNNNDILAEKEDLFEHRLSKSSFPENKQLTNDNKMDKINDRLFNDQAVGFGKRLDEKIEDGIRPSPPSSLKIVKRLDLSSNEDNKRSETDRLPTSSEIERKEKVIGKLNIPAGLNINPMNLLPGATIKKNIPVENTEKRTDEDEKGGILDKPSESAPNLLKCLSKDRVKIQTRRRPQTRRARHEALRSSGIDFGVNTQDIASVTSRSRSVDDFEKEIITPSTIKSNSDTNVNDSILVDSVDETDKVTENADSSNSIFHSVENSPEGLFSSPLVSNPLSPSTDEEDYFNVPELDMNFEKEDQSIFKTDLNDFTSTDKTDDNLLFDGAPVLSPMIPGVSLVKKEIKSEDNTLVKENLIPDKIRQSGITIDDEDAEDSLFKAGQTKSLGLLSEKKDEIKSRTSNIFDDLDDSDSFLFKKKPISILGTKEVNKNTLFDDNDEDDDLFNDKSVSSKILSKITKESVSKSKVNKTNVAEKSQEPFVDPLGLMTNPD